MANESCKVLNLRRSTQYVVNEIQENAPSGTGSAISEVMLEKTDHPYLYNVTYRAYNKDDAYKYAEGVTPYPSACTGIRHGNFYGRNLDFIYSEGVTFVVKTPHTAYKYATIGFADCIDSLSKSEVEKVFARKKTLDIMDCMPWFINDGMNEYGVVCNTNVVMHQLVDPVPTNPLVEKRDTIYSTMVIRYILDNFKTAREAVEYLRDYVSIKMGKKLLDMGYHSHWMVADPNETFIIECVNKQLVIHEGKEVLSNFYVTGVNFNADGTVYTNADAKNGNLPTVKNNVLSYGVGLERHNIATREKSAVSSAADMRALLTTLKYTKSYTIDPANQSEFWYSEFVGGDYTVDTLPDDAAFLAAIGVDIDHYNHRSTDPTNPNYGSWWTQHSTVYDMVNKTVSLVLHEEADKEYQYSI